jgi:hypothetical protein
MFNGFAGVRPQPFIACACAGMAVATALFGLPRVSPAYEVVTVTNGGTIDGYVTLSGALPAKSPIKITKDQDYCGTSMADPSYSVGDQGGLKNVIVYLEGVSKGKAAPAEPIALVTEGCTFRPRVRGAMVGERLTVSSTDPILHNVHPQNTSTNATIYNVALPFPGVSITKTLPAHPGLIKIKDDAHEWMQAWIMELDHPYYATTGDDGHFTIKDVPPGSYTLVAWHEAAGEQATPVTVVAGRTARSMIAVAPKQGGDARRTASRIDGSVVAYEASN